MKLKFRTIPNLHPTVIVLNPDPSKEFCGDSWCIGDCGYPALVLKSNGVDYKLHGDSVAVGSVFQPFRVRWIGEIELIGYSEALLSRMWY